jgi:hypothetical protein
MDAFVATSTGSASTGTSQNRAPATQTALTSVYEGEDDERRP